MKLKQGALVGIVGLSAFLLLDVVRCYRLASKWPAGSPSFVDIYGLFLLAEACLVAGLVFFFVTVYRRQA